MPDDLPRGRPHDDEPTLDELVQLRDQAQARAERYGTLTGQLNDLIAEHEDNQAEREAQRRRAAFRIITGNAILTTIAGILKKLSTLGQIHPLATAGTLGAVALASGVTLAVLHYTPDSGPGLEDAQPPMAAAPSRPPGASPSTPPGARPSPTPRRSASPAPSRPRKSRPPATGVPDVEVTGVGELPDTPTLKPPVTVDPPDLPPLDPGDGEMEGPAPVPRRTCAVGLDLDPILGLCVLGRR